MEALFTPADNVGRIACCDCGTIIQPNPTNMCVGCVRSRVDITEGIPRQSQLYSCKGCNRFFIPPSTWTYAEPESKELLSVCLRKLKPNLSKVRLVDASFIWTEPHSKRIKIKITVQKEVFSSAILQQSLTIEFIHYNQMCDNCRKIEAKDYWRACVQVRQRCDFKKTLFYLEQLILKHSAHSNANNIKPVPTGIDFYFARQQDAKKLVEFISSVLPCKCQDSQQLVTHDIHNNFYDYKHTFCIDIVPITKDALICLPKRTSQHCGSIGQFVICLRVSNIITLIDPATTQTVELASIAYWKDPFEILMHPKTLVEFFVLDVDDLVSNNNASPHEGRCRSGSTKHRLADIWVVRSHMVGQPEAQTICCRSHLGHLLSPGDVVLGYDILNSNLNNSTLDSIKSERVPDAILVRKSYDRSRRRQNRKWKLKRLNSHLIDDETASTLNEFNDFLDDVEEDKLLRERINIYKRKRNAFSTSTNQETVENSIPDAPKLAEMLDDLDLDNDEDGCYIELAAVGISSASNTNKISGNSKEIGACFDTDVFDDN